MGICASESTSEKIASLAELDPENTAELNIVIQQLWEQYDLDQSGFLPVEQLVPLAVS